MLLLRHVHYYTVFIHTACDRHMIILYPAEVYRRDMYKNLSSNLNKKIINKQ